MSDPDALAPDGGRRIGWLIDFSGSSFQKVMHITTCGGGMVTTDKPTLDDRLRRFRNLGIYRDVRERQAIWRQDMVAFGSNHG